MSLLDRYIARSYLLNVVTLLVILFCFVVTIDVSVNLDRFSSVATKAMQARGQTPEGLAHVGIVALMVADLWWPRLFMLFNFLLGLVMVGAMGFTCVQMMRRWEFVAVLASGQSLHRVWRPILVVSAGLLLVQAANQQWVMPRIAPLLTRDPGDAGKHDMDSASVPMTVDGDNRVFRAALFDPEREVLTDLTVYERTAEGQAVRMIQASSAVWDGSAWRLDGVHVTVFRHDLFALSSPHRIETNLSPTELKRLRFASFSRNLSWSQLGAIIRRNRDHADQRLAVDDRRASARLHARADDLERIRFGRVSTMVGTLLAIVICLPFFVTRVPKNMVIQSMKCAPVAMAALMGALLGAEAPIAGVPPQLAVFAPVLVLAPLAVLSVTSVKT